MLKLTLKPHRKSLKSGTADPQKVFAMLKLIPDGETAGARPPLAMALVIDTSASMYMYVDFDEAFRRASNQLPPNDIQMIREEPGILNSALLSELGIDLGLPTFIDQAIDAAHALVDDPRLIPADTIAIVNFGAHSQTLLPATPLSNKAAIHSAINRLRDEIGSDTLIAEGLYNALQQMEYLPPETAKRVFVLTDGAASDEDKCDDLLSRFRNNNAQIVSIGFSDYYNEDFLRRMADATQGRPYHLKEMTDLMNQVLPIEIGRTVNEVVTDLKAYLSMVKGVTVDSVTRVHPGMSEVNISERPYRLGNIATGDYTVFIFELTVSGLARPASRVRIAQLGLSASAPGLDRSQEFTPLDLHLEFTTDEAAVATVDPEVIGYVQQKNIGNMVNRAMATATTDVSSARQTLQVAVGMTQRLGNTAATRMLNDAMQELDQTGTISVGTHKTVALGLRTQTVKTASLDDSGTGGLTQEQIRKMSGT